jgi:hypothetical protein
MKLCIHCQHCDVYAPDPKFSKCNAHGEIVTSLVTGEKEDKRMFCNTARIEDCGPEACDFIPIAQVAVAA